MYDYNCPDCNEAKLQSDKNARKINEVIDQVNALIQVNNETVDFIEEKAEEKVEEIAEIKVNEVLGDLRTEIDNITTVIDDVDNLQNIINDNKGSLKFVNKSYTLLSRIEIKGNTIYNGNNCTINISPTTNINIPQGEKNIVFRNFNFVGDLKHTKVVELLDGGMKIKVENNIFSVGEILGSSIYGVTDKPYVTVTDFDGSYYTLDKTLSSSGSILNNDFGVVIGNFTWGALITGGKDNDNITFENCTFSNSYGYSLTLPNTSYIKINNCKFLNNGLDFILFSAETKNVNNIEIKNCIFDKSIDFGKQGIVCNSNRYMLEDIVIELNDFNNISESAISFGYAQGRIKNVSIKNNRFRNNYLYDIHISGDGVEISNNIFENTKQCSIKFGDNTSIIYPNTSLMDNILIKHNIFNNVKNGITITPMKLTTGNLLYPCNCNIDFNTMRCEYIGIEYGGNGLNVRNNFVKCDKNNGSPNYASTILINNVNGVKSENINIINNQFEGQVELKWVDTRLVNIKDNVINKALINKMVRIQDMSVTQTSDTLVKIQGNVFYKSPTMSLQTGKIELKTEYSLNKIIDGSTISNIPFMKGRQCYYDGTVNHWKHSSNNNIAATKDNYLECNGKFIYVANDGTVKATDDVTITS